MGDTAFVKMLAEMRRRYEYKTITTDEFRELCAEFLPAGSPDPKLTDFFDQWVYDTGMPTLKLTYTVAGQKLSGTITQSDVPDDFTVLAPVEIRVGNGKPIIRQIRTSNGSVKFTINVSGPGAKATLDPGMSVLRR
jgi:aminopeptidase N